MNLNMIFDVFLLIHKHKQLTLLNLSFLLETIFQLSHPKLHLELILLCAQLLLQLLELFDQSITLAFALVHQIHLF
jgi:hypothetical protein